MAKLTYFPLLMDRWIAGTKQLTFEQKGFYIDLLVYLYDSGRAIKDADHAARITGCDPRTSRRLLADLSQKFYRRSDGLRHKLVTEILKKGGKINYLGRVENLTEQHIDPEPDPEPEEEEERKENPTKEKKENCPHKAIIALYHEHTPCRRIREWDGQRPGLLRALWRKHPELEWWTGFFQYVAESDFLCGRSKPKNGDPPFMADLEWLIRPNNFQKIYEGKYHRVRQTQPRTDIGAHIH